MKKKTSGTAGTPKAETPPQTVVNKYLLIFLALLATAIVAYIRVRLLPLPLERDEGEYAYMGQSILNGVLPYAESYNMKLPGTYYMYALIMAVFGQSPTGIHTGLLLFTAGSAYLLFLCGKKLLGTNAGAIAAATFLALVSVPGTYGYAAHASHFIVFFTLAGLAALLKWHEAENRRWLLLSGFCFGLAFLMKQQAVVMLVMGGILMLYYESQRQVRNPQKMALTAGIFSLAGLLPYILIVIVALATGTFDKFWYWTVSYARQYVGITSMSKGASYFSGSLNMITDGVEGFWILGVPGALAVFFLPVKKQTRWTVLIFFLFSFLSICPGLYFRNHYFIAFLPALSLAFAAAMQLPIEWSNRLKGLGLAVSGLMFGILLLLNFTKHIGQYFKNPVREVCARMYGRNPFQESLEVARFIQNTTAPGESIAIIGSEPQIYFYSKRKAATGYLYTYPLMEKQAFARQMQQEMINDIERTKPKYLVVVNCALSWLATPESDNYILQWYANYSAANYHLAGFVDMINPLDARYILGDGVQNYRPQGSESIAVMERN